MKKIQFVIVIICINICTLDSFGQKRPFSEFTNDTVAYMTYNFYEHQEMYQGQRLEKFFQDFDLDIKAVCLSFSPQHQLYGIDFCTRPAAQIRKNAKNDQFRSQCSISIIFRIDQMPDYPASVSKHPIEDNEVITDWKESYREEFKNMIPWMFFYDPEK